MLIDRDATMWCYGMKKNEIRCDLLSVCQASDEGLVLYKS